MLTKWKQLLPTCPDEHLTQTDALNTDVYRHLKYRMKRSHILVFLLLRDYFKPEWVWNRKENGLHGINITALAFDIYIGSTLGLRFKYNHTLFVHKTEVALWQVSSIPPSPHVSWGTKGISLSGTLCCNGREKKEATTSPEVFSTDYLI